HDDGPALPHHAVAELSDGGGLADPVHADEEPHVGALVVEAEAAVVDGESLLHLGLERLDELVTGLETLVLHPPAKLLDEFGGGSDAEVGPDEGLLEIVPGLLIDRRAPEESGECGAGAGEAFP